MSSVGSGAPPCTTLPAVTSARLMRPLMGARTRVHSRLSFAVRTAASAPWIEALASALPLTRASYSSREIAFSATSGSARSDSRLRERGLGLRAGELGLGPVERVLVLALVDDEEHVALLHLLALGERHLLDEARDPRPDLDVAHRLDAAGELIPLVHGAPDGGRGGDRRWRRRGRRRRLARCQQQRECTRADRAFVESPA